MIREYDSTNAIEFFKYADCYIKSEIRNYISYLYKNVLYTMGIEIEGKPVGFIAVEKRTEKIHVCQGIFITEKYRGKGLSEELLMAAIEKSQSEGVKEFYCSYFENREWTEAARSLYTKFGFELSGYVRNTYVSERSEIGKSIEAIKQKYKRYLNIKEDAYIKKISELTVAERENIQMQLGNEIPCNFNPIVEAGDKEISVILFKHDNPVSWMIFERRGANALYVNQLYVKEKFRNKGYFFPIICTAFDGTPEQFKRYFFYVNGNNDNMLGLFKAFKLSDLKHEKMIEIVKKI